MNLSKRTRAELILLALTFAWGTTFALTKFVFESSSVFLYIFLRFSLAAVLFALLSWKQLKHFSFQSVVQGGVLGFLLFIGFVLQTMGLQWTTASKSAFITGMMVVFAPFFQFFLQRQLPQRGNIFGILLVIIGLYLLTAPEGTGINIGDIITLGCAISFGLYLVLLDGYTKKSSPVYLTFVQFAVVALCSIPMMLFEKIYFYPTPVFVVLMVYFIIVPTIVALFLQAKYQKDTTPARSAVIFSLEPLLASLFAFGIINERLSTVGMIGGMFIISGVLVSELLDTERRKSCEEKNSSRLDFEHIVGGK